MNSSPVLRRIGAGLVVAAAGVLAAAFVADGSAGAVAAPATTTDPAHAAAGWLASRLTDGNHLDYTGFAAFDGGTTADVVFALAASGTGASTVSDVLTYYAANADSYTNASSATSPYAGSAAKAATAFLTGGQDPTDVGSTHLDLIAAAQTQCTAVDTSDTADPYCPAIGAGTNVFSSISESFIMLASARAGRPLPPAGPALTWFATLQCPNGGFTATTDACTDGTNADIDATAYAAMALSALAAPTAAQSLALTRARDYLTGTQNADGSWTTQNIENPDSTGLAAAAGGGDAAKARTWLAAQQITTGPTVGATATRGALRYGTDPYAQSVAIKATADGLLGLSTGQSLATVSVTGDAAGTQVLALAAPAVTARARRGEPVTVSAPGFAAGEKVSVTVGGASSCTLTATAAGTAAGRCTVPAAAALGSDAVVARGLGSGLSSAGTTTVLAAASTTPSASPTGSTTASPTGSSTASPTASSSGPAGGGSGQGGSGSQLAATGTDGRSVTRLGVGGAGLMVAGLGLLVLGRRPRGRRA